MARKLTEDREEKIEEPKNEKIEQPISLIQYFKVHSNKNELFVKYLFDKYGKNLMTQTEWDQIIEKESNRRA